MNSRFPEEGGAQFRSRGDRRDAAMRDRRDELLGIAEFARVQQGRVVCAHLKQVFPFPFVTSLAASLVLPRLGLASLVPWVNEARSL